MLFEPRGTCKALNYRLTGLAGDPLNHLTKAQASATFKRSPGDSETQSALRTADQTGRRPAFHRAGSHIPPSHPVPPLTVTAEARSSDRFTTSDPAP